MPSTKRKEPSDDNNEDEIIRQELVAHHAKMRQELLAKHARALIKFDEKCQAELTEEGFGKSEFVKQAKADRVQKCQVGYCCVCKEGLTMGGKAFPDEDADRDGWHSSAYDGEMCFCCKEHFCDTETGSVKCSKCVWPLVCARMKHGFCSSCMERVNTDNADANDIPNRHHPNGMGGMLERRDFLHPFVMCDCGICAWCAEDRPDECCKDHTYQHCSCFDC